MSQRYRKASHNEQNRDLGERLKSTSSAVKVGENKSLCTFSWSLKRVLSPGSEASLAEE